MMNLMTIKAATTAIQLMIDYLVNFKKGKRIPPHTPKHHSQVCICEGFNADGSVWFCSLSDGVFQALLSLDMFQTPQRAKYGYRFN